MEKNFNKYYEDSFKKYWNEKALSDYNGTTYLYKDLARKIAKLHIVFEQCGLKKGDKVSIAGRNSSHWGIAFLATITYGAVAVPILHEFKPDNMHNIINHSESRLLFVGDVVWEGLSEKQMPNVEAIVLLNDFNVLHSKKKSIVEIRENVHKIFKEKYKDNFSPSDVKYHNNAADELAVINYTSGTTGFSKGVLIPYRALALNVKFAHDFLPEVKESNVVSMLPMAHMYGLMFEFLFELSAGCHVNFLTRMPTPKIILDAFAAIKPKLIITVPLVIEKIYKNRIAPILQKPFVRLMMSLPIIDKRVSKKILKSVNKSFGDNVVEIVIGGAAFNLEVETFFKKIGFAYTVGYGMTECAPLIAYDHWTTNRLGSCGKAIPGVQVKIHNPNPETKIGEIIVKGDNVFMGYYKNPEETNAVFDADGWFHTGDLGIIDDDGYIYIKGRSKNMILSASGQNVYPEEIESLINNLPYVNESVVVENDGKLVALIYPDYDRAYKAKMNDEDLERLLDKEKNELNKTLPAFSQIARIKLYPEEFEKTPKKSIKRFLYQK